MAGLVMFMSFRLDLRDHWSAARDVAPPAAEAQTAARTGGLDGGEKCKKGAARPSVSWGGLAGSGMGKKKKKNHPARAAA
jgi:hypothetical protein